MAPEPRLLTTITPNRLVTACRALLAALLLTALVVGPDALGNIVVRFAVPYALALTAITALPQRGGREIAAALSLLLAVRWAFEVPMEATIPMLAVELAGVGCALAPIYARDVGRLAGAVEGHISFTERRAMWRRRGEGTAHARSAPAPKVVLPVAALLDYRPSVGD